MIALYRLSMFFLFITAASAAVAQKIAYSEPERDDTRRMDFEIIGKMNGNFMIYKNIRNKHAIVLLDNDMKQISRVEHDYLPSDRLINVDFLAYPDFSYMFYQYQKRNVVYCMAVKINAEGKKASDPIQLDTTHIGFSANNKIYNIIPSEDKTKFIIFKINSRNRRHFVVTTVLFDDKLEKKKRTVLPLDMDDNNDYLDEYHLDNEGNLVFVKYIRSSNDVITKLFMIIKGVEADSLMIKEIDIEKNMLDEIHIKVDNFNKRYFLSSFYYKQRRGNIDGIYFYVWDINEMKPILEKATEFSDELRKEARGDASLKMAFNDYFIRNVITKKDGGFIISSEAFYTTSRFGNWNRWDYLYGNPFLSPFDYYSYSTFYNSSLWRSRYYGSGNQSVRHHADNVVIISFDKEGNPEWTNVISKEQFDDESDDLISYQVMNTGGQLHYLFNKAEKRTLLLNDYSIAPDGKINRNPTLKNLDKGFEFMLKYAKQVSSRQMIIPCFSSRNSICFAKIEYN
jgi:hypothetical protein